MQRASHGDGGIEIKDLLGLWRPRGDATIGIGGEQFTDDGFSDGNEWRSGRWRWLDAAFEGSWFDLRLLHGGHEEVNGAMRLALGIRDDGEVQNGFAEGAIGAFDAHAEGFGLRAAASEHT